MKELILRCNRSKLREARELARLLSKPHLQALINTHDQIGEGKGEYREPQIDQIFPEINGMPSETIRMVGIRRKYDEPLGLTVEVDEAGFAAGPPSKVSLPLSPPLLPPPLLFHQLKNRPLWLSAGHQAK